MMHLRHAAARRLALLIACVLVTLTAVCAHVGASSPAAAQTPTVDAPAVDEPSVEPAVEPSDEPPDEPSNVVIVSMPRVRWSDVTDETMPVLKSVLPDAAAANLSVRSVRPRTTLEDGYATLGAGNRALAGPLGAAAFNATERIDNSTACEVYERRTGRACDGAVLQVGVAPARAANAARLYGAVTGALGGALASEGMVTAVFGNADGPRLSPTSRLYAADSAAPPGDASDAEAPQDEIASGTLGRGVAFATVGSDGVADHGNVSETLLVDDATRPYGLRLSAGRVVAGVAAELPRSRLIVVEASDLERADRAQTLAQPAQRARIWRRELRAADRLLGALLQVAPPATTRYVVVAPAAPRGTGEELTVFATFGAGVEPGLAVSPSTRRAGYVTLVDVAPTVLDTLGVDRPSSMTGRPVTSAGGTATVERFVTDNRRAVVRDAYDQQAFVVFILAMTVLFVVSIVVLWRRTTPAPVLAFLGIWAAAVPVATFFVPLLPFQYLAGALNIALIVLLALAVAAGCWATRRHRPAAPVAAVCAVTVVVLLGDLLAGSRLELNSMLGYSPIVAGRFTGVGNLGYSLVVAAAIVLAAVVVSWTGAGARTMAAVGAGFAVVVIVIGAPMWGADVGGVIAGVPTFVVAWLLLARVRIRWQVIVVAVVVMAVAVASFAAFDLSQPAARQTHLARLVQSTTEGGGGALATVLRRKLDANIRILLVSDYIILLPVTIAFIVGVAYSRVGMRDLFRRWPTLKRAGWALIVAGVLGMAVNDSGAAIPAMMLWLVAPLLLYLRAVTDADSTADVDNAADDADDTGADVDASEPRGSREPAPA